MVIVDWIICVRCHLPSGKTVWLCTEHQKQDGVAILSDEVADVNNASQETGIDVNSAFKDLLSSANERAGDGVAVRRKTRTSGDGSGSGRSKQAGLALFSYVSS